MLYSLEEIAKLAGITKSKAKQELDDMGYAPRIMDLTSKNEKSFYSLVAMKEVTAKFDKVGRPTNDLEDNSKSLMDIIDENTSNEQTDLNSIKIERIN